MQGLKDDDRPLKKRRLTQSPSIGTVLHCMGSTELRLETRLGTDVTTVADVASRITAVGRPQIFQLVPCAAPPTVAVEVFCS